MATQAAMEIELSRGSALPTATTALQRTREQFDGAVRAMKSAAYEAGRSLTRASSGGGSVFGRDASRVEQTVFARKAYHARADAEAEKYRAAYLGLAAKAREGSLQALKAAAAAQGDRREEALRVASRESETAEALERSANKVEAARQSIGEPDVVSAAVARRLASDAGVSFGSASVATADGSLFTQGPANVAALMPEFFPDEVQRAASALSGVGDAVPTDWWGAVRQSLGMGAASVGDAAMRAGQEETRNNAAAGAVVASIGGALSALGLSLTSQLNAGQQGSAPPVDGGFPWAPVLAGSLLLGGLYLVWRAA